jgi:hypothetical protein
VKYIIPYTIIVTSIIFFLCIPSGASADWRMPGHDPQRTSYAPEDNIPDADRPLWHVPFNAYIPSKAHIITVERSSNSMVYVPTSDGVYALNPDTGARIWHYQTSMPVGHSPTVVNDVMYVPVLDKTIHAVNAITGKLIWQTDKAGAGFYTNPLVVNGKVYAGNRDGYFYAIDAENGNLLWYYKTEGPINFSAAYSNGVIYFASNDSHAYALNANTGSLVWKSTKFPGDGFLAFWPVVHNDVVLYVRAANHSTRDGYMLIDIQSKGTVDNQQLFFPKSSISGLSEIDAERFARWNNYDPDRETLYVLNKSTGKRTQTAPILWWGTAGGNRYPPAIGPNGRVWINTPWHDGSYFGAGRYAGWQLGTTRFKPIPSATSGFESADEPEAHAIFGGSIYHNDGGDGVDKGGIFSLSGGKRGGWTVGTYFNAFGNNWYGRWQDFRYGNGPFINPDITWGNITGHHGYQNPPVPLNGKVYFHRSNTVICMRQ